MRISGLCFLNYWTTLPRGCWVFKTNQFRYLHGYNVNENACPKLPEDIVTDLDRHIIGQDQAKRSLAIALRDRWRRQNITDEKLRKEVTPNNILLVGPSGCGKTELAKRLAAFSGAPFVKVVATKYTEVGIVGDDTQNMVHDLAEQAFSDEKNKCLAQVSKEATRLTYATLANILMEMEGFKDFSHQKILESLQNGSLNDIEVEIDNNLLIKDDAPSNPLAEMMGAMKGSGGRGRGSKVTPVGMTISAVPGSDIGSLLNDMFGNSKKNRKATHKRRIKVKDAVPLLEAHHSNELVNEEDITEVALATAEQQGIIFIDEFDKLVDSKDEYTFRSKRRDVQKELLSLMEGTTVSTRIGRLSTDHILFIASGSFHSSDPKDIMPELQGRLPIRCQLKPLSVVEFIQILKETEYNLIMQQQALLETEGVTLNFSDDAIAAIAGIAYRINCMTANVGARRLKTVMAKLLEEIKFDAHQHRNTTVTINEETVQTKLNPLLEQADLTKYIL